MDCWARSCSAVRQLDQPAGTLSGGEKTRLALAGLVASTANVLLLDEPTNNLDPASREQVLDALRSYLGAVVLVTHDPGAAEALDPQRVVLLPDGTEDFWSEDYRDPHRTRLTQSASRFAKSARRRVNASYAGYTSGHRSGEVSMKKLNKSRDQLLTELRSAYERGASIRSLGGVHRPFVRLHSQHAARVRHHYAQPRRAQPPQPSASAAGGTEASTRSSTALSFSGSSPEASRATSPSSTRSR